jgi:hypothetical protein
MKKETIEKFLGEAEFNGLLRIHFVQGSSPNHLTRRVETGNRTSSGYAECKYRRFRRDDGKVSLIVDFSSGCRYIIGQEHIKIIERIGIVQTYSD